MLGRLLILDRPFEHPFQFLSDDLLFNEYLVGAPSVGFHAAGDEAAAGDDLDGGAELAGDAYGFEDRRVARNSKNQKSGVFDARPLEGVGVADVALDDVDADVGTAFDGLAIELDNAEGRVAGGQDIGGGTAWHAKARDDRVALQRLSVVTTGPVHQLRLRRIGHVYFTPLQVRIVNRRLRFGYGKLG